MEAQGLNPSITEGIELYDLSAMDDDVLLNELAILFHTSTGKNSSTKDNNKPNYHCFIEEIRKRLLVSQDPIPNSKSNKSFTQTDEPTKETTANPSVNTGCSQEHPSQEQAEEEEGPHINSPTSSAPLEELFEAVRQLISSENNKGKRKLLPIRYLTPALQTLTLLESRIATLQQATSKRPSSQPTSTTTRPRNISLFQGTTQDPTSTPTLDSEKLLSPTSGATNLNPDYEHAVEALTALRKIVGGHCADGSRNNITLIPVKDLALSHLDAVENYVLSHQQNHHSAENKVPPQAPTTMATELLFSRSEPTFAQVLGGPSRPSRPKPSTILIYPQENSNNQPTEEPIIDMDHLITSNIDPTRDKLKICAKRRLKNGGIALDCPTQEDMDKLLNTINGHPEIGNKVLLKTPPQRRPRCIIYNVPARTNTHEVLEALALETDTTPDTLEHKFNILSGNDTSHWVVELPPEAFAKLHQRSKLSISWVICNIREFYYTIRCTGCQRYGHTRKYCSDDNPRCGRCGKGHPTHQCQNSHSLCINCLDSNLKYNTKYQLNHSTNSPQCSIYKKEVARYKKSVDYI